MEKQADRLAASVVGSEALEALLLKVTVVRSVMQAAEGERLLTGAPTTVELLKSLGSLVDNIPGNRVQERWERGMSEPRRFLDTHPTLRERMLIAREYPTQFEECKLPARQLVDDPDDVELCLTQAVQFDEKRREQLVPDKDLCWYCRRMPGARSAKIRLLRTTHSQEQLELRTVEIPQCAKCASAQARLGRAIVGLFLGGLLLGTGLLIFLEAIPSIRGDEPIDIAEVTKLVFLYEGGGALVGALLAVLLLVAHRRESNALSVLSHPEIEELMKFGFRFPLSQKEHAFVRAFNTDGLR